MTMDQMTEKFMDLKVKNPTCNIASLFMTHFNGVS